MADGSELAQDRPTSRPSHPLNVARVDDPVPISDVLRAALDAALSRVPGPVVLAVSGGRDSMALMHAAARWAPGRLAAVATFDHATGGYATEAVSLVAASARRLGLTVVRERSRSVEHTEAGWRAARWRFLQRVARAYGAQVATAHTRDDQVETIFMRLLRGAGARGLAALAASSPIVRPWLPVGRSEVAAWAAAESVPFLEDPMNIDRRFLRGRVRHDLLPAFERARPGFGDELLSLGERAAAWRRAVDDYVDTIGSSYGSADATGRAGPTGGALRIPVAPFLSTTDEGCAVLWPACLARLGVVLDASGTHALVRFSKSERRGAWITLAGGATVMRAGRGDEDWFEVRRPSGAGQPLREAWSGSAGALPARLGPWRFRRMSMADAQQALDDRWCFGVPMHSTVTIRGWNAGDRIVTAGAPAGRRVTRYFSDAHVPALDRSGWPVVLVEGALLCVPGLCRAVAAPHRPGSPDSIWYQCEREHNWHDRRTGLDPRLDGRAVKRIVYDANAIRKRVSELADQITDAYPEGDLLVLGLLKGSFIFLSDLVRHIARPLQVDFLVASSYGDAMESSGVVRLLYDPETELEGKHILLVEDIVDSGRTLNRLIELLEDRQPKSLEICALLHKHIAKELKHPTRFVGFDAPHEFLVGYGLDHAENFRHLPYVASLQ